MQGTVISRLQCAGSWSLLRWLRASSSPAVRALCHPTCDDGVVIGVAMQAPGITSKGGAIITELPEGAPVAVYAQGKERCLAVGTMLMSTADM